MKQLRFIPGEPKPQNDLWGTIVDLFFEGVAGGATRCRRIGKVVSELKAIEATPEEVRIRKRRYEDAWPGMACTPEKLVWHWSLFAKPKDGPIGVVQPKEGKYD